MGSDIDWEVRTMGIFKKKIKVKEEPNKTGNVKKKKKKKQSWVSDFYYGRTLSMEFFRSYAWFFITFVVIILALMGLRYDTKSKMKEIKRLTTELERAQSSKLQEKAAYMSLIRETEMKRLVEEKGLGLEFQEFPPYILELDKD